MTILEEILYGRNLISDSILCFFIVVVVYCLFNVIGHYSSPLSKIRKVPGWPLINQIPHYLTTKDECALQLSRIRFAGEEGLYRYLDIQGVFHVGVCKPQYLKQIFVTHSKKYRRPRFFSRSLPFAVGGLFLAEGSDHAWQRKLMQPVFSHASVKCYIDKFKGHCSDVIKVWAQKCDVSPSRTALIKVEHDLTNLALDIIGDTAFGQNFDTVLSGNTSSTKAFTAVLEKGLDSLRLLLLYFVPYFDHFPTTGNLEFKRALETADEIVNKVIQTRRQSNEKHVDLLSVMMTAQDEHSGKTLSDAQLVSNVWTFIVAGHETTSTALTWTLYYLAKNPEIQEKARNEAFEVLKEGGDFNAATVDKLVYNTAVVKESLRIAPPGAHIMRECVEDDWLGDYFIPKGTTLGIPILGIHHCEEYWPEPGKFIPERFLDSDDRWSSGIYGQTYIPFTNGPRSCIGAKFGLLEIKVVLAQLLTNFRFGMDSNHPKVGNKSFLALKSIPSPELKVTYIGEGKRSENLKQV